MEVYEDFAKSALAIFKNGVQAGYWDIKNPELFIKNMTTSWLLKMHMMLRDFHT